MIRSIAVGTLGVLAMAGGLGMAAAATPKQAEDAIRAQDAAWEAAVRMKDLEKTVAFYSDDAAALAAGHPVAVGKDAIRKEWQRILTVPQLDLHWQPVHIEVARSGDIAYDVGTVHSTSVDAKGNKVDYVGKYVVVWKKDATGEWRVAVDISNSDG